MNYDFLYYVTETDDFGYGRETLWKGFNSYNEACDFYNNKKNSPNSGRLKFIDSIKELQSEINRFQLKILDINENIKKLQGIEE